MIRSRFVLDSSHLVASLPAFALLLALTPACELELEPDLDGDEKLVTDGDEELVTDEELGRTTLAATTYTWHAIHDSVADDGVRRVNVRVAIQAKRVDGLTTHVRSYLAVTCWRHGSRYPCSLASNTLYLRNPTSDTSVGTTNSGTDGYYSAYGPWRSAPQCGPSTLVGLYSAVPARVGVYGKYFNISGNSSSYYFCDL